MAKQDVGFFDVGGSCPDLVIENGDLKADEGLETAALISLFSDKRVTFEELPNGFSDRRGWWADLISQVEADEIGSKLWLVFADGKLTNATPNEVEDYMREAFQWMLDDGISSDIEVSALRVDRNSVEGSATIGRPNGQNIPFNFIWNGQKLKILEG